MSRLSFAAVALLALAAAAAAQPTNVCNLDWNYCPRDPGCLTYTMSVHSVEVIADTSAPVKAEDIPVGTMLRVIVQGETTLTQVPVDGSWRIYDLAGHNAAAGVLSNTLKLDNGNFVLDIAFNVTAGNSAAGGWFEFGVDVFQASSGSDEGVCIEVASIEYVAYEIAKPTPPFEMYCKDEGNGHFISDIVPLTGTPIPSQSCTTSSCSLHWYYCPRDPGCLTYAMSVTDVNVYVADSKGINAGDSLTLVVNGTTSLTSVSPSASFRIYDLAGHNAYAGVLADVLTIHDCGAQGCYFGIAVTFTVTDGSFNNLGWFEFGLDTFQQPSGTLEAFCIEIANDAYVTYEQNNPQPPPGFVTYCQDQGWGHFISKTIPEVVHDAVCHLE